MYPLRKKNDTKKNIYIYMYKIQFCIVQFDTRAFWEIFIEMSNIRRCGAS